MFQGYLSKFGYLFSICENPRFMYLFIFFICEAKWKKKIQEEIKMFMWEKYFF